MLSPKCHAVHIYNSERESNFPEPPSFPKNVTFYKVKQHYKYNRNQYQVPTQIESNTNHHLPSSFWKRFLPESLKEFYRRIRAVFFENLESWHAQSLWFKDKIRYYSFSLKQSTRSRSDILIAVDVSGLIAASLVSLFSKISPIVIFWSLEIDTNKSNLLLHRFHKYLFSKCFFFVDSVVIQEESRLIVLAEKLKLDMCNKRIFFIPHSPIGSTTESHSRSSNRSNFFKEKFSLSENEKIILHAGWIHDAMCVDKIAESSKSWKKSYRLVLHEREQRSIDEPFIKHVLTLSEKRALLSLKPVSFERMDELFGSADIGIIAYEKRYGGGRENAHKASGKLGQYLKCGIPVVALNLPGYAAMFEEYKCGKVFNSFQLIENCIDEIFLDYESYRNEAIRCFEEQFDFKKFFNPLLSDVSSSYFGN